MIDLIKSDILFISIILAYVFCFKCCLLVDRGQLSNGKHFSSKFYGFATFNEMNEIYI